MDLLAELEAADQFVARHIGPTEADIAEMLLAIGRASLDDAAAAAVPESIRSNQALNLPPAVDEAAVIAELRELASRNVAKKSLIGMGYHGTVTPPVVLRNVLESPGWYTAYTPYQAEIAQGRLEALVNFQTLICELTGMEIANASLLDEATAAAEAMAMAHAISKTKSDVIAVADDVHPQTRAVLTTAGRRAWALRLAGLARGRRFAILLQYPGTTGEVRDLTADIAAARAQGALVIVAADPLAMVVLKSPGEMGADIVVGSSQRFGVPMGFGGPHAAFFATRDAFKRHMPGRLVGVSIDAAGEPAMRLALQTREQHIRREKATSNICTAQVLLAVIAGMYAVWHGPDGLRRIASRAGLQARMLADCALRGGHRLRYRSFFDTIVVECADPQAMMSAARAAGFNFRLVDAGAVAIALDETVTRDDLAALASVLGAPLADAAAGCGSARLLRTGSFLAQSVFNRYHSEQEMTRYLKRLEDKDIALNRSMIPLGSCTMKLNATAEMIPITLPGFSDVHPFAPQDQCLGFRVLIQRLSRLAKGVDRIPGCVVAAQCRLARRVCGVTGDLPLARIPGRHASRYLPDPVFGAWHQSGQCRDGGTACRCCRLRSRRQCRSGRSACEGGTES